jgi:hypothetical protein
LKEKENKKNEKNKKELEENFNQNLSKIKQEL